MALSDAAAIHKMVCKSLLPPQVLSARPKPTHAHGKPGAFYLLKIHLCTLLRTAEKLFKIQLFARGTLKFQFSLCLMLHNEH